MRTLGFAFGVLALSVAIPAYANVYRFDVTDPDQSSGPYPYHFLLDSSPTPSSSDQNSFSINGTTFTQNQFGLISYFDSYTFYTVGPPGTATDAGGGFDNNENVYLGPQLFTGLPSNPTFTLGTYALDNFASGASVTISDTTPSTVPEPATWAMLLLGIFGIGALARTRRRNLARAAV